MRAREGLVSVEKQERFDRFAVIDTVTNLFEVYFKVLVDNDGTSLYWLPFSALFRSVDEGFYSVGVFT